MYKLQNIGEFGLIKQIQLWLKQKKKDKTVLGIGDDAAVIPFKNKSLLVSKDVLLENTHFTRKITSFYELGWKSLAVNISDIAAMGGKPLYALVAIGIPKNVNIKNIKDLYNGFKLLADKSDVKLIGGDTVKSRKDIMVSVTIIGETAGIRPVLRSGAKTGDYICVTGTFGNASYGLNLLKNNIKDKFFLKKFNTPMPRYKEAVLLAKNNLVNSMMDSSDGLVLTLYEIMNQSKTGCNILYDKIPISKKLINAKGKNKALKYALYGGEDYELVFTVPSGKVNIVKKLVSNVTVIGKVIRTKKIKFVDSKGKEVKVKRKGYEAF